MLVKDAIFDYCAQNGLPRPADFDRKGPLAPSFARARMGSGEAPIDVDAQKDDEVNVDDIVAQTPEVSVQDLAPARRMATAFTPGPAKRALVVKEGMTVDEVCEVVDLFAPDVFRDGLNVFQEQRINGSAFLELEDTILKDLFSILGQRLAIARLHRLSKDPLHLSQDTRPVAGPNTTTYVISNEEMHMRAEQVLKEMEKKKAEKVAKKQAKEDRKRGRQILGAAETDGDGRRGPRKDSEWDFGPFVCLVRDKKSVLVLARRQKLGGKYQMIGKSNFKRKVDVDMIEEALADFDTRMETQGLDAQELAQLDQRRWNAALNDQFGQLFPESNSSSEKESDDDGNIRPIEEAEDEEENKEDSSENDPEWDLGMEPMDSNDVRASKRACAASTIAHTHPPMPAPTPAPAPAPTPASAHAPMLAMTPLSTPILTAASMLQTQQVPLGENRGNLRFTVKLSRIPPITQQQLEGLQTRQRPFFACCNSDRPDKSSISCGCGKIFHRSCVNAEDRSHNAVYQCSNCTN